MSWSSEYTKLRKKRLEEEEEQNGQPTIDYAPTGNSWVDEYLSLRQSRETQDIAPTYSFGTLSDKLTFDTLPLKNSFHLPTKKELEEEEREKQEEERRKFEEQRELMKEPELDPMEHRIAATLSQEEFAKYQKAKEHIAEVYPTSPKQDTGHSWFANSMLAGLNSFNKSLTATADVILGRPLQALGWQNNPISSANQYYNDLYDKYKGAAQEQIEDKGGGTGMQLVSTLVEGTTAAAPNAILAFLSGGSSVTGTLATTGTQAFGTSVQATSALGKASNLLSKAGMTVNTMAKNPQFWFSFAQTYGNDYEEAKKAGADDTTAALGATITSLLNAGIEIGPDGASGIQGLPDALRKGNKSAVWEWAKSSVAEGNEEVLQGFVNNLVSKAMYDSETDLFDAKEMATDFVMGTAIGSILGGSQIGANTAINGLQNIIDSNKSPTLTANEQAVANKEYESRIAELEADGTKLTDKDKSKIYDAVLKDMEKGYISTDTIEEALGGETFKSYQDTINSENSLTEQSKALQDEFNTLNQMKQGDMTGEQVDRREDLRKQIAELNAKIEEAKSPRQKLKDQLYQEVFSRTEQDTLLRESYIEKGRRGEAFEADLTKYDAKQQAVIQKAVESGILNNTRRTHEFVDMVAKISADKGVLFDFTNNTKLKESGFALDGKSINGFVTKDGVTLNVQSSKALNSVVGHEITHVLEGTELYTELQNTLFRYAKSRNDYQSRYEALTKLYKDVEGANIEAELTADLVGDYLFTDSDFISKLSTENRNVFQKIYDEIKYLYKVATAGSKEARELEKVKRAFDKAYKETGKLSETDSKNFTGKENTVVNDTMELSDTDNSSEIEAPVETEAVTAPKELTPEQKEYFKNSVVRDENGNLKPMYHGTSKGGHTVFDTYGSNYGLFGQGSYFTDNKSVAESYTKKGKGNKPQVYETYLNITNPIDMDAQADAEAWAKALPEADFPKEGTNEAFYRAMEEYLEDNEYPKWEAAEIAMDVLMGMGYDGITHIGGGRVKADGVRHQVYISFHPEQVKNTDNLKPTSDPDIRYSLSEDSEGNELSPIVQKRFANSKAVDENGRLKVLYHGTTSGEFSIFDKAKGYVEGDFGSGFYFTDNEADVSEHYEGGGPDFEQKVALRAERIEQEEDISYDEAEVKAREELYKGSHKFEVYLNVENPAIVGETPLFSSDTYLEQYNEEDYEDYEDYIADVEQLLADDIENIIWEVEKNVDVYSTDGLADVLYNAYYEGGIGIEELKAKVNELYLEDSNGNLVGNEVTRQIIESLGYDGIIDPTVSGKWNMDIEEGTTHYIVFKPNQIKSIANQNPTDNPDIHRSLSAEGEEHPTFGNYNVYGKDIALEEVAPATEETAQNVSETENVAPEVADNTPATAPIQTEEAEPVQEVTETETASQHDLLAELGDLLSRKEELEDRFYQASVEAEETGDYEAFNRTMDEINAEFVSLQKRIEELQVMTDVAPTAEEQARIDSLADAEAPPEVTVPYPDITEKATATIDDKTLKQLSKTIGEELGLNRNNQKKLGELIQEYSRNGYFTREDLFSALKKDFGTYTEASYEADLIKEAKQRLRTTRVTVRSERGDIADYNDFMRRNFGKIRFSKDGMGVDEVYQELSGLYPHLFPEDIVTLSDQLWQMEHVANMPTTMEVSVDDGHLWDVTDSIVNRVAEYSRNQENEITKESFDNLIAGAENYAPVAEENKVTQKAPAREYEAIRPQRPAAPAETTETGYATGRLVRVDRPLDNGKKQRRWVETSTESEVVNREILPKDLDQDAITYQPISNRKTLSRANAKLDNMGYEESVTYFNSQLSNRKTTVEDIALGERLIQEAMKRGDTKTAGELIQNVAILGTELGQKVQALSIIQRMTPEGQLKMLQKLVNRGKAKGDKAYEGVVITQEMIDKILKTYGKDGTYNQDKLNEVIDDVKQQIADQMKVTALDKVNAWRYLSMLGNPKTHIRNLVSNVAMRGTVAVKNALARTIESVAPIQNRTKTWKAATEEIKTYAKQTAVEMKGVLSDDSKYNEDASIKDKRTIFKNKILNGMYELNSEMLNKEDWWFSKPAFVNSLSEFLTANGINTKADIENNPELVAKGKLYAMEQSQIATFRQYSWLANKINEIERKNTLTSVAVGSVLPFKKTPINIAKTGLNYSPLGFAKTLTYDIAQVKKGNMEASKLVDNLAQNVTGTTLTLIGYLLASAGLISGAGEDDKEGKYDYQIGKQAYALNIGDKSYSLSWLSPVAMPLFVGANAYEQLVEGEEWNGDVVIETLAQTLDPLSEMSFLSSLDTVLKSYDNGIQKFAGIGEAMVQNYATQFVPTLSSQIAAITDDTKRTTQVAADSEFKFVDQTINKLMYKIPGLRQLLEPSVDIWGNDVKQTENVFARAFENMVAPYSAKENIATEIDEELKALYSEVGDSGVIPSVPDNYVNFKGEKYEMSAKEYTAFKKTYGQTALEMMEELFDTTTYQSATSEEQADMVNRVYDYARDQAKREYLANEGVSYTNATKDGAEYYKENLIKGAIENDMGLEEFDMFSTNNEKYTFLQNNNISFEDYQSNKDVYDWAYKSPSRIAVSKAVGGLENYKLYSSELYELKADEDANGKTIRDSRKAKVIDYINSLDIDYGAKLVLFKKEYNADDTYNNEIVEYLNGMNDLSYEEVETILKELGFTVLADGTVLW